MRKLIIVLQWAVASVAVLGLVTLPISLETQLVAGLFVVLAMMILKLVRPDVMWRLIALAFGTAVVLRYVYWRSTSTLPPITEPVDFIPGFILYLAEMYCFAILAISLVINVDPLHRPRLGETPDEDQPTVDVFIPTYNEDEYILATTIAAARSMLYPPETLTVWLCDDGGTEQKCNDKNPEKAAAARERRRSLMALCEQLGAKYHTREKNLHAKAGNMNACLADSHGDIIVVFDADHAPFRMFLRETIGHFIKDPIAIASNHDAPLLKVADHAILTQTGPEILSGSTRMSAGTSQKAVMNSFSTALMTRLGHVHDGLMVSMIPTCAKLHKRAAFIVSTIAECETANAERCLRAAETAYGGLTKNNIKLSILIARNIQPDDGIRLLDAYKGHLRPILRSLSPQ